MYKLAICTTSFFSLFLQPDLISKLSWHCLRKSVFYLCHHSCCVILVQTIDLIICYLLPYRRTLIRHRLNLKNKPKYLYGHLLVEICCGVYGSRPPLHIACFKFLKVNFMVDIRVDASRHTLIYDIAKYITRYLDWRRLACKWSPCVCIPYLDLLPVFNIPSAHNICIFSLRRKQRRSERNFLLFNYHSSLTSHITKIKSVLFMETQI